MRQGVADFVKTALRLRPCGVCCWSVAGSTSRYSCIELLSESSNHFTATAGVIVTDDDGSGAAALTEFLAAQKFV